VEQTHISDDFSAFVKKILCIAKILPIDNHATISDLVIIRAFPPTPLISRCDRQKNPGKKWIRVRIGCSDSCEACIRSGVEAMRLTGDLDPQIVIVPVSPLVFSRSPTNHLTSLAASYKNE
jgi:hypothetical protein